MFQMLIEESFHDLTADKGAPVKSQTSSSVTPAAVTVSSASIMSG